MAANGRSVEEYSAPLFVAWQLTNRCAARCIACCEESGPDKGWDDELSREEAVALAQQIADAGVTYVAFGGGEPLGVRHCWEVFECLSAAGVALKLETDGRYLNEARASQLVALARSVCRSRSMARRRGRMSRQDPARASSRQSRVSGD